MPINVAIIHDHHLFRKLIAGYLCQQRDIDVVFEAADASELFSRLGCIDIDVVLMDIFLPKINGIDAATILRNEYPSIRIVIVSLCTDANVIKAFLDIGVYAYLSKN